MFRRKIIIFVIFLCGLFDLYGQVQKIEALSIDQCLILADEKQQEGKVREASYYLNTAADKCWEAKEYQKAIEYYNRSIKLNEIISNFNGIAGIHCNLGLIYFDIGEYEKSYEYLKKSYQYRKDQNEKYNMISGLINISVTLNKMKRYDESINVLEEGLSIARDLNNLEQIRSCYGMLSEVHILAGNSHKAAEYFDMYKAVHDAISGDREKQYRSELTEATIRTQLAETEKELAEIRKQKIEYEFAEISKALQGLDATYSELLESKSKAELIIEVLQVNEKNVELEKLQIEERLKNEQTKNNALIVGLLTMVFVAIVIVYFFIQKKKDNLKITEKNHELKELHEVKDKLFSVVAHDLRNPVSSLMSVLQLSQAKMLDEETQKELLKDVSKRVEDVQGLLDNLLQWAKSQMQGLAPVSSYFDVQEESLAVTDTLQNVANAKSIVMENRIGKHQIFADRNMFTVVVRNLTTNAIKYTSVGGSIILGSELSGDMLVVSVKDTGTGMTQETQKKLFKLSETKSRRGTNNETGIGLGLVLCADFVKANGGNIWFTSVQGEGSTFFFNVPMKH